MPLYFEDLQVGNTFESPTRTITEADLVNFAGLSGDFNPLHTDEEFAKTTEYGHRIAHGALVLSIVTGLRQRMGLFDRTIIGLLEIRSWRFLKPVYIGDTLHAVTVINELRGSSKSDRGLMIQGIKVLNQHAEMVQEGEFVILIRRRHPEGVREGRGGHWTQ